jgi:hypothetical protein
MIARGADGVENMGRLQTLRHCQLGYVALFCLCSTRADEEGSCERRGPQLLFVSQVVAQPRSL